MCQKEKRKENMMRFRIKGQSTCLVNLSLPGGSLLRKSSSLGCCVGWALWFQSPWKSLSCGFDKVGCSTRQKIGSSPAVFSVLIWSMWLDLMSFMFLNIGLWAFPNPTVYMYGCYILELMAKLGWRTKGSQESKQLMYHMQLLIYLTNNSYNSPPAEFLSNEETPTT